MSGLNELNPATAKMKDPIKAIGSRPAAAVAVLITSGVLATMLSGLINASSLALPGFQFWVTVTSESFGITTELGLVIALFLLIVDNQRADDSRARPVLFAVVSFLGLLSVIIDLAATISLPSVSDVAPLFAVSVGDIALIAGSAAPMLLAAFVFLGGLYGVLPSRRVAER